MKIFRNYQITGNYKYLLLVLANMKKVISMPFAFDSACTEEYANGIMKDIAEVAVFKTKKASLFESKVYVYISNDKLIVANIISSMMANLDENRYNIVVEAFSSAVKVCLVDNVKEMLSSSEYAMEQHLSQDSFNALENWVEICPKNSPFGNSLDEERWFKFILSVKNEKERPAASVLGRWLSEDKEWPVEFDDKIEEVEEKYSYSLSLLKYYDSQNEL